MHASRAQAIRVSATVRLGAAHIVALEAIELLEDRVSDDQGDLLVWWQRLAHPSFGRQPVKQIEAESRAVAVWGGLLLHGRTGGTCINDWSLRSATPRSMTELRTSPAIMARRHDVSGNTSRGPLRRLIGTRPAAAAAVEEGAPLGEASGGGGGGAAVLASTAHLSTAASAGACSWLLSHGSRAWTLVPRAAPRSSVS